MTVLPMLLVAVTVAADGAASPSMLRDAIASELASPEVKPLNFPRDLSTLSNRAIAKVPCVTPAVRERLRPQVHDAICGKDPILQLLERLRDTTRSCRVLAEGGADCIWVAAVDRDDRTRYLQLPIDMRSGRWIVVDAIDHQTDLAVSDLLGWKTTAALVAALEGKNLTTPADCQEQVRLLALMPARQSSSLDDLSERIATLSEQTRRRPEVLRLSIEIARRRGDVAAELAAIASYRTQYPERLGAPLAVLTSGLKLGLFEEVAQAGKKIGQRFPSDAYPLAMQSAAAIRMGQLSLAGERFGAAVRARPNDQQTHRIVIAAAFAADRPSLAADVLNRLDRSGDWNAEWLVGIPGYRDFLKTSAGARWRRSIGDRLDHALLARRPVAKLAI